MKKISALISFILAFVIVFGATACKKGGGTSTGSASESNKPTNTGEKLFDNGKTDYTVVIPKDATDYEKFAAQELTYFLNSSAGGDIKTKTDDEIDYNSESRIISLGNTSMRKDCGATFDESELGVSGYKIISKDKSVFISGADAHGTLYGVYDFLSEEVGYEFFSDDEIALNYSPTVELYNFDKTEVPDIQRRSVGYKPLWNSASYTRRLRLVDVNEDYIIDGHTFGTILPNQKYSKEHPDWFADPSSDISQPCFTNEDAFNQFVENSKTIIKKHVDGGGTGRYFMLGQNDNGAFCSCAKCTAKRNELGGAVSALTLYFVNRVSAAIDEWLATAYPGYKLEYPTYAYIQSMDPPITYNNATGKWNEPYIRPRDNVFVEITPLSVDWTYSFDDPRNSAMNSVINGWGHVTSNLWIYSYCVNFKQFFLPYNNYNFIVSNYRVAKKYNMYAYYEQGANQSNTTGLMELKFYLMSNLMWNTELYADELAERFIKRYYGPVADYMLEYYKTLRTWYGHISEDLGFRNSIYADLCREEYWPFDLVEKWQAQIFDKAYASIEYLKTLDEESYTKYFNRIKKENLTLTYLFLQLHSAEFTASERNAMIDEIEEYSALFQLNYYIEGAYTKDLIESWRKKF